MNHLCCHLSMTIPSCCHSYCTPDHNRMMSPALDRRILLTRTRFVYFKFKSQSRIRVINQIETTPTNNGQINRPAKKKPPFDPSRQIRGYNVPGCGGREQFVYPVQNRKRHQAAIEHHIGHQARGGTPIKSFPRAQRPREE